VGFLPQELGFASGMTRWRRLRDWNAAGVWQGLHEFLLAELRTGEVLDLSRASVDGSHLRALKGGGATGPSPVDRGKKRRRPAPGADPRRAADPRQARTTRRRPDVLYGDRGYDHDKYRRQVRELGIRSLIGRRGTGHGSGLGKNRWVVEAAFALPHWFRRLRIRWEIRADIHRDFLTLGCAMICWRRLKNSV